MNAEVTNFFGYNNRIYATDIDQEVNIRFLIQFHCAKVEKQLENDYPGLTLNVKQQFDTEPSECKTLFGPVI